MSKITFRADDELIEQLEEFDASKSEVMREALRTYLDGEASGPSQNAASATGATPTEDSLDDLVAERVDAIIADRLETAFTPRQPQDINVNIALDGDSTESDDVSVDRRKTPVEEDADTGDSPADERTTCQQCGENLGADHVYCPNCGEKAARRVFCECGDELRSDWAFCPGCGRRTPAADVLDKP
ncbi:CopG family transcriptional regulator [Halorientalis sp. IM1011]|uniref:double zinc ribbon domain-containing protein n=1 Tax=Halorientalis sp. IM1011 TaxID=1932360 RepID=UPI00097CCDFF|nr:zinc ribbon domain-containing protein [Halorientalis sp. IM1011]AQL42053.1 CopG family transcriptional regulator [Halorientalis sp. IM1011]